MARVNDKVFFKLVHDFFKSYLPLQKRSSRHTIRAYQTSLDLLLTFIKEKNGCRLAEITFEMLNAKILTEFLDHLENERECSISTRNHRQRCIMAFMKYAASIEPTAVTHRMEAQNVPLKKDIKGTVPDYMNESALKAMLDQPDVNTQKGIRDMFLMILLYDSGARIQELLSIRICDLKLGNTPTMNILGKGSKPRTVPLMRQTVEHLMQYLKVFHDIEAMYSNVPLFYIMRSGTKAKMSVANAERLVKQYGERARLTCPDVPANVYPHMFRHSRAMHLYQHGMDLTLIAQWLGHSDITTTLIYAYADTEQKRTAIEKAMGETSQLFNVTDTTRFEIDNDETLRKLYGLR